MVIAFAAATEAESQGNVALETLPAFFIALAVFALLALVALSYRNVANRHSSKADAYAQSHATDLQQHGHGH